MIHFFWIRSTLASRAMSTVPPARTKLIWERQLYRSPGFVRLATTQMWTSYGISRPSTNWDKPMVGFDPKRTRGIFQFEETAPKGSTIEQGSPICSIQPAPHVPNAAGREWLRCMDARQDRRSQLGRYFRTVCPPIAGRGGVGPRKARWAQFWAQRRIGE